MNFDPNKDYYKILGVSEDATQDDIKKAFRKLAVKYHPDKKGGDKAKFQEINEAHQTLANNTERQQYDMYRKGGMGGMGGGDFGGFGGFGGGQTQFDIGGFGDLGDLLGGMFGGGGFGGGSTSRPRKGEDLKKVIEITFEEGFLGTSKKIRYERMAKGEGITEETCKTCKGSGAVAQQARTPFGVVQTQTVCNKCGGIGKTYKKDGKEVGRYGLESHKETVEVDIPAGINDGVYLKFGGKGNAGIGDAPAGDLYIKINIKSSDKYERKGDNLHMNIEVTIFDLVLGGEVEINHPEGKMKVKIPKGTQLDDFIKVAGKGFGESGVFHKRGDLYLKPEIYVPKRLTKEQEKLWHELQKKS